MGFAKRSQVLRLLQSECLSAPQSPLLEREMILQ